MKFKLSFLALAFFVCCSIANLSMAISESEFLCQNKKGCKVVDAKDAGVDKDETSLKVVTIQVTKTPDEEVDTSHVEQAPYEYWLIKDTKPKPTKQLIIHVYNNGYGVAMMGDDQFSIFSNTFTHSRSGGSSWRWQYNKKIQLSPAKLVYMDTLAYWNLGSNVEWSEYDWQTLTGRAKWYSPDCKESEEAKELSLADISLAKYKFYYIPLLELADSFVTKGYQTTNIKDCSLTLPTHPNYKKTKGEKSPVHVVAAPKGTLFVQVEESKADEEYTLDLLLSFYHISYYDHCLTDNLLQQDYHHYRMSSKEGFFKPVVAKTPVKIGVTKAILQGSKDKRIVIYKIKLPEDKTERDYYNITLSYKSGQKHYTTSLTDGTAKTLGQLWKIEPKDAICRVKNGKLVLETLPNQKPEQALLRDN